jgi:hypothetical protein
MAAVNGDPKERGGEGEQTCMEETKEELSVAKISESSMIFFRSDFSSSGPKFIFVSSSSAF